MCLVMIEGGHLLGVGVEIEAIRLVSPFAIGITLQSATARSYEGPSSVLR
jgi:hypothetical protein